MCEITLIPFSDSGQLTASTHYHGDLRCGPVWRDMRTGSELGDAKNRRETHGDAKNRVSTAGGVGKRWVGCFRPELRWVMDWHLTHVNSSTDLVI